MPVCRSRCPRSVSAPAQGRRDGVPSALRVSARDWIGCDVLAPLPWRCRRLTQLRCSSLRTSTASAVSTRWSRTTPSSVGSTHATPSASRFLSTAMKLQTVSASRSAIPGRSPRLWEARRSSASPVRREHTVAPTENRRRLEAPRHCLAVEETLVAGGRFEGVAHGVAEIEGLSPARLAFIGGDDLGLDGHRSRDQGLPAIEAAASRSR